MESENGVPGRKNKTRNSVSSPTAQVAAFSFSSPRNSGRHLRGSSNVGGDGTRSEIQGGEEKLVSVFSTLPAAPKWRRIAFFSGSFAFFFSPLELAVVAVLFSSTAPHPCAPQFSSIDPFLALDAIASMSIAVQGQMRDRKAKEKVRASPGRKRRAGLDGSRRGGRRQRQAKKDFSSLSKVPCC